MLVPTPALLVTQEAVKQREMAMDRNLSGFLIGCVGAAVTLLAYNQTIMSTTQCITAGLLILVFGLFVKEGFISF
ncbi:hypothetical protein LUZ62_075691 [Rhynchospora pubera]|uniref:Uncharacterized protein n=1 Tax=Rhynchospora pubera TaxID=906938 RepID=A0AAV8DDZ6_9POAL|nr:hypothetical protein LUZ62_075691 [Rhynchospora pubera]